MLQNVDSMSATQLREAIAHCFGYELLLDVTEEQGTAVDDAPQPGFSSSCDFVVVVNY